MFAAPSVPLRVWLSHWSYNLSSPQNQTFNLNYAKYWTENIFHTLLTGSDSIIWWNSSGEGTWEDTRTTADRTAESTAMNTLLQEFDSLTYFRQDRTTLINNLIGTDTNYVLTGMRVPNHYNLYRLTPNQDSGQATQILQRNPAIFLVNGTTRIKIPNGEIYTPANNVAPYGYWITQPLNSGNPIIETGTCVNTCIEPPPECTNECTTGQLKCSDTTHKQTCGQYDLDDCFEWSAGQVCSGSTACGYGSCSVIQRPAWSCKDGKCVYVCSNSQTCKQPQAYIKNYRKECYNNNVYWYDSTGQIQDIYDECQNLYCDNAACVDYNPEEYCKDNSHCKDDKCNCGEDALTCPEDCSSSALALTLFAKDKETGEWKQGLDLTQSQDIEFLLVVSNNSPETIGEVTTILELPAGITYQQNLEIDDVPSPENITYGMNIGFLEPFSEKKITFLAKVSESADAVATIIAKAESNDIAGAGAITIGISKSEEKQSFLDLVVQFVSSYILLTTILVAVAYLIFAVAGYMLFKRFAG